MYSLFYLFRGIIQWQYCGLQNRSRGFESLFPCMLITPGCYVKHFGSVLLLFAEPPHLFAFVALAGFSFVLRTKSAHMVAVPASQAFSRE